MSVCVGECVCAFARVYVCMCGVFVCVCLRVWCHSRCPFGCRLRPGNSFAWWVWPEQNRGRTRPDVSRTQRPAREKQDTSGKTPDYLLITVFITVFVMLEWCLFFRFKYSDYQHYQEQICNYFDQFFWTYCWVKSKLSKNVTKPNLQIWISMLVIIFSSLKGFFL